MKNYLLVFSIMFFLFSLDFSSAQEISNNELTGITNWYNTQLPQPPPPNQNTTLSLIKVKGNRFVNSEGDTLVLEATHPQSGQKGDFKIVFKGDKMDLIDPDGVPIVLVKE